MVVEHFQVFCNVHESCIHHLIIDHVLCSSNHSTSTCIKIIYEEGTHLSILYYIRSILLSLPDKFDKFTCISTLQFSYTHHNGTALNRKISNFQIREFLKLDSTPIIPSYPIFFHKKDTLPWGNESNFRKTQRRLSWMEARFILDFHLLVDILA